MSVLRLQSFTKTCSCLYFCSPLGWKKDKDVDIDMLLISRKVQYVNVYVNNADTAIDKVSLFITPHSYCMF